MLPKTVKIGSHVFRIKMCDKKDLAKDSVGGMHSDVNTIWVYRRLSRSRKVEVLIHECLHAMVNGREFPDEELIIQALGESLTQLFTNNPGFVRKLLKELSDTPSV